MRIKKYYCKHCGQFRSILQVYESEEGGLITVHTKRCKYCDREVIETAPEFKKWLKIQQEGNK